MPLNALQINRQRTYAILLILGAGILLYRTISMIVSGAMDILVPWVFVLLLAELLIDVACILAAIPWLFSGKTGKARPALNFGAAAALLHAFRVLLFVLGRVGPWIDFDVRLEQRADHATRWTWLDVYFAAIMSVLGIVGVLVIWSIRRKKRSKRLPV